jgi:hypothetical protein
VSGGAKASFLNLGGTEFGNSVAPVFIEVCDGKFWQVRSIRCFFWRFRDLTLMASFWGVGIYTPQPPLLQATVPKVAGVIPCYSLLSQGHSISPQTLFVRLFDH